MKSSCISHPEREPLVIRRQWQVEFCEGTACAAELMSFFEYWHNIKLDQSLKARESNRIADNHGEEGTQDTSLFQFHTEEELIAGLLGGWSGNTINKSLRWLGEQGVITITGNPNPRYKFDKTRYFLFHPEIPQRWLHSRSRNFEESTLIIEPPSGNFEEPPRNSDQPPPKSEGAITEITSETTYKDYTQRARVFDRLENKNLSDTLMYKGEAVATRQACKEMIEDRAKQDNISEDDAWGRIQEELITYLGGELTRRVKKTARHGRQ